MLSPLLALLLSASVPSPLPAPGGPLPYREKPILEESAGELKLGALLRSPEGSEARRLRVEIVAHALGAFVPQESHPQALRLALSAYYNFRDSNPGYVYNPYFYYVDFGLDNLTPRGYVFNMETLSVVEGPFTVAHGRGSALEENGVPTLFSNRSGSAQTSLGLYLAQETYAFQGSTGGTPYRSLGMRVFGLSGEFNNAAFSRHIVVHGAPYVTSLKAGRSEGCPAMEPERAERLLPLLANGGLIFLFSPGDHLWMERDPWANRDLASLTTPS